MTNSFPALPGFQALTIDGGMSAPVIPAAKKTLILGTSGIGPVNVGYNVASVAQAAADFGLDGTLIQAAVEVCNYCDNVVLYRIGTQQGTFDGVGTDLTTGATAPGYNIVLGQVSADAGTRYNIWYNNNTLYLWLDGNLIYVYDSVNGIYLNSGDSSVSPAPGAGLANGLQLGTGLTATLAGAISLTAAAALTGTTNHPKPTMVPPVTGLGMTQRQVYVALDQAFDLLSNFPVDQVICPQAIVDNPNVAYYVASDPTTAANNPVTNPSALDWLQTSLDAYGNKTYHWASELKDSNGLTVAAATFLSASDRLAQGYHEVHFPYALARYAQLQEVMLGACLAYIGTNGPPNNKYDLVSTRKWVGYLPTYDVNGKPVTPGSGMCGIPLLVGTTVGKLNQYCADFASGARWAGMFQTETGEYDGTVQTDDNGNPIDLGAYLYVQGDQAVLSNGYASGYVDSIVGIVAGYASKLDDKSSLTNKAVPLSQLWKAGLAQQNALDIAKVNILKFAGDGNQPRLLHFNSAAAGGDYINGLRMRIKGLMIRDTRAIAQDYIGESSTDGLLLAGLNTALESDYANKRKKGYISYASATVTNTPAGVRLGRADMYIVFNPAQELVQLKAHFAVTTATQ